jgi:hypothetical protein
MFSSAYLALKPHVVAIAPRFSSKQLDYPEIIGTGFFVAPEGVVCTCRHIADAITKLPHPDDFTGFPAIVWRCSRCAKGTCVAGHVKRSRSVLSSMPPE